MRSQMLVFADRIVKHLHRDDEHGTEVPGVELQAAFECVSDIAIRQASTCAAVIACERVASSPAGTCRAVRRRPIGLERARMRRPSSCEREQTEER